MAVLKIYFTDDKAAQMLALLQRDLAEETDKVLARNLRMQIKDLEKYSPQ